MAVASAVGGDVTDDRVQVRALGVQGRVGIVLGSVGWWLVLSALVAQARSALPPAMVRHLSRVVGLLLLALALRAGFGALGLP